MAIRDLALLGLVIFSGQMSSATRIGPKKFGPRQDGRFVNSSAPAAADVSVDFVLPTDGAAEGSGAGLASEHPAETATVSVQESVNEGEKAPAVEFEGVTNSFSDSDAAAETESHAQKEDAPGGSGKSDSRHPFGGNSRGRRPWRPKPWGTGSLDAHATPASDGKDGPTDPAKEASSAGSPMPVQTPGPIGTGSLSSSVASGLGWNSTHSLNSTAGLVRGAAGSSTGTAADASITDSSNSCPGVTAINHVCYETFWEVTQTHEDNSTNTVTAVVLPPESEWILITTVQTTDPNDYISIPDWGIVTLPDGETCTSVCSIGTSTIISVVHTETITFTGDPADYTPPYPDEPSITPYTYCPTALPNGDPLPEGSVSVPPNMDGWSTFCFTNLQHSTSCTSTLWFGIAVIGSVSWDPTRYPERASKASTTTADEKLDTHNTPLIVIGEQTTEASTAPVALTASITSTFYHTDKNPSVVFVTPSSDPPDYGKEPHTASEGVFHPAGPGGGDSSAPQSMKADDINAGSGGGGGGTYVVTADPTKVVINEVTITGLPPAGTTTVRVDDADFVINPSQVIEIGGGTVSRPYPGAGLYVPSAVTTTVGGLSVEVAGDSVVIDGYTYAIAATSNTEIIKGQTVVIGPNGIDFLSSKQTISFDAQSPEQTEIVVAGGELITAIGQSVVVVHSTTYTYGRGIQPDTVVVDDDTIVIGPSGVTFNGKSIGGKGMGTSDTKYDIVGGATLTQIGSSKLVINGHTYTVGPGTGTTTTVVGGETITIGPDGVTVSTLTLPYPFGPTVVSTLKPQATATGAQPEKTGGSEDDEDIGTVPRPDISLGIMGLCIAIGVWLV